MKYILLLILLYWITQRVFRIYTAVDNDPNSPKKPSQPPKQQGSKSSFSEDKGEYVDFEEID